MLNSSAPQICSLDVAARLAVPVGSGTGSVRSLLAFDVLVQVELFLARGPTSLKWERSFSRVSQVYLYAGLNLLL